MYLNDWKEEGFIGMVGDFADIYITKNEYEAKECPTKNEKYWHEKVDQMHEELKDKKWDINVLLASYGNANYEGGAFVLFEKDGKLFEVNGGHCSCYGLEGQWEPEETTAEALQHRLDKGELGKDSYCDNEFHSELLQVLSDLSGKAE